MADEEINEGGEPAPEGNEDSAPFRAMIARAEAAEAELEGIKQVQADAALVSQQARMAALEVIVNARQIPALKDDLFSWIEGDITEATVEAALQAKGLNFVQPTVENIPLPTVEVATPEAPLNVSPVPVSTLAQQVADAASGATVKDLDAELAEADDPATVARLMKEAGAAVSYT
jgi:hypothetical protein